MTTLTNEVLADRADSHLQLPTQSNPNLVKTELGFFKASAPYGYIQNNERYFKQALETELAAITAKPIVNYRLDNSGSQAISKIRVNRVDYVNITAQVDVKRQSVWFFGTKANNHEALTTAAREKLQAIAYKDLVSHATNHIAALQQQSKVKILEYAKKSLVEAAQVLKQKQADLASFM